MFTFLIFLAVLSLLVLAHETGHYAAACVFGVKAHEFGYGFPPRLIGFVRHQGKWKRVKRGDQNTYSNTIWSLNWLPLGGFVRLKGEDDSDKTAQDSFAVKNAWKRLAILAAGVCMNWILAAGIFIIAFSIGVPMETDGLPTNAQIREPKVTILEVLPSSPAFRSGLRPDDVIQKINQETTTDPSRASDLLKKSEGKPVTLTILRHQKTLIVQSATEFLPAVGRQALGVVLIQTAHVRFSVPQAIVQGVRYTLEYTKLIVQGFAIFLRSAFRGENVSKELAGPVGIAMMTGQLAEQGTWPLFHFAALLSINLSIINFLPIPALDGGRAFFVLLEGIRRKKINQVWETGLHQLGFALLLGLIALVTWKDLRLYGGTIIQGAKRIIGI